MMEYIGFIAAFLTTVSFLPQAYQTITTQDTKGISFLMYIIFSLGVLCWLLYGISLNDKPMIYANIITLILSSIILCIKIKNMYTGADK